MVINGKNNQGRLWLCFHSRFSPCGHPAIKDNPITGTSTMWIPGENNLQMIEWNLFPLLWTLDNDETDSRSLNCPLLRELIGISLFHKVMYWLFMYIFLVSLVKVLSKSFPGQEQQHSADDSSSLGIISGIVASSLLIIFIIVGLLLYRHGGLRYLIFCISVCATDILYWLSLSVSFLN